MRFASERFWTSGYNQLLPDRTFLEALERYDKRLLVRWNHAKGRWEIGYLRPQDENSFYYLFEVEHLGGEVFRRLDAMDVYQEGPQIWVRRYLESRQAERERAQRRMDSITEDCAKEIADRLASRAPDALR